MEEIQKKGLTSVKENKFPLCRCEIYFGVFLTRNGEFEELGIANFGNEILEAIEEGRKMGFAC